MDHHAEPCRVHARRNRPCLRRRVLPPTACHAVDMQSGVVVGARRRLQAHRSLRRRGLGEWHLWLRARCFADVPRRHRVERPQSLAAFFDCFLGRFSHHLQPLGGGSHPLRLRARRRRLGPRPRGSAPIINIVLICSRGAARRRASASWHGCKLTQGRGHLHRSEPKDCERNMNTARSLADTTDANGKSETRG